MGLNKQAIYDQVNQQLLAKLRQGTIPWRRSLKIGLPSNYVSNKLYEGINFINLCLEDYPSPHFLTFLQCQEKGGSVIKGAKGNWIVYYAIKEVIDKATAEIKRVPILKRSIVFNLSLTTLFEDDSPTRELPSCEAIIQQMNEPPLIMHNTTRCYYSPVLDYISLPNLSSFEFQGEYYSALFHELIHWTGYSSHMNRQLTNTSELHYSYEELIAEIGSCYLCSMCGIAPLTLDNSAAYIQGWLASSEKYESIILKAAIEAQRAVNFILGKYPSRLQLKKCS